MNTGEPTSAQPDLRTLIRLFPVVFAAIGISIALLPWSLQAGGWSSGVMRALAIVDPVQWPALIAQLGDGGDGVSAVLSVVLERGEIWRLVTPAFLHFDLMHVAFNGAIVYVLGQRLELRLGTFWMLVFTILSAAISNVVQLWWSQQVYFGGLSGVAFALFGGLLALGWLRPSDPAFALSKQFSASILFFLVLFSTGVTEVIGLRIANAAHWGGLGAGVVLGLMLHGVLPRARN